MKSEKINWKFKNKFQFLPIFALLFIMFVGSIQTAGFTTSRIGKTNDPIKLNSYDSSIPFVVNSKVVIDGNIGVNEYGASFYDQITKIHVYWEHNDTDLKIGMVSPGTGWVAFGFGSEMTGSNIIEGGVSGGSTYCRDTTGTGYVEPTNDTDLGGSYNIKACKATENSGSTTLEFIFPLSSSDNLDPSLNISDITPVFLGYQASNDAQSSMHTSHSGIFNVFIKPLIENIDTKLTISMPSRVKQGANISIGIRLTQLPYNNPIPGITINLYRETNFGNLLIGTTVTNLDGSGEFRYSNDVIFGNVTFVAQSVETLSTAIIGTVLTPVAYQSSQINQTIMITDRVIPPVNNFEQAWGNMKFELLTGYWIIGLIIWVTFIYIIYSILKIFKLGKIDEKESEVIG